MGVQGIEWDDKTSLVSIQNGSQLPLSFLTNATDGIVLNQGMTNPNLSFKWSVGKWMANQMLKNDRGKTKSKPKTN